MLSFKTICRDFLIVKLPFVTGKPSSLRPRRRPRLRRRRTLGNPSGCWRRWSLFRRRKRDPNTFSSSCKQSRDKCQADKRSKTMYYLQREMYLGEWPLRLVVVVGLLHDASDLGGRSWLLLVTLEIRMLSPEQPADWPLSSRDDKRPEPLMLEDKWATALAESTMDVATDEGDDKSVVVSKEWYRKGGDDDDVGTKPGNRPLLRSRTSRGLQLRLVSKFILVANYFKYRRISIRSTN